MLRILAHPSMKFSKSQVYFELTDSSSYNRDSGNRNCHLHCVQHIKNDNAYYHITGFSFFDIDNRGLFFRPNIRTLSKPKYIKPDLVRHSSKLKIIGVDLID